MHELTRMSASELAAGYRRREFSPVEVVAAITDLASVSSQCNALTTPMLESAMVTATSAEAVFASDRPAPALLGLPFVVKDIFDVEGVVTTCGSRVVEAMAPDRDAAAAADATAVSRLTEAGAVLIGKTNTFEFAWGITSENDLLGTCRNPWDMDRTSGGSSSGSAVAVALGLAPIGLGTDTAGSVRIPAAFCGVTGLRPTPGRISTAGVFPLSRSFDTVGILARHPSDISLASGVMSGPDPADPQTYLASASMGEYRAAVSEPDVLSGLRVGVATMRGTLVPSGDIASVLADAIALAGHLGAEVVEIELPAAEQLIEAFAPIQAAEAHEVHHAAGLYPRFADLYGAAVRTRLGRGAAVGMGDYLTAMEHRRVIQAAMATAMADVDIVVSPVSPVAPPLFEPAGPGDGSGDEFRQAVLAYTTAQVLAGLPACSVNVGFDDLGLPVGLQLTGAPGSDDLLVAVAQMLWDAAPGVAATWPTCWRRVATS